VTNDFDAILDARIAEAEEEGMTVEHVEGWRFRCADCDWTGPIEDYMLARMTGVLHTKECQA
jgi:hypothetical protein